MTTPAAKSAPHDGLPSVLRFATELVAWVATPWWLAGISWWAAIGSLVVLVVVPGVLGTPGDKGGGAGGRGAPPVAVPGWVTIVMVLLELGAAVVSSWALWPAWAAVCVCVLATAALVAEQPRWRWLARQRRRMRQR